MVRQRWMYTDLPFLPLGTNCVLLNRIWESDDVRLYDVGMLPLGQNNYHQDERFVLPPNFAPTHICNPEWLSTGEPWPNDLPPTLYDDFWIPFCCGPINHLIVGGVQVGGPVAHVYGRTHSPLGGYQFGGSLSRTSSFAHSLLGGVEVGGLVEHVVAYSHATLGGVEVGGEVEHVVAYSHATLGGVEVGGEVEHSYRPPSSPAGGFEVGGEVEHSYRPPSSPLGGVDVGGEVLHVYRPPSSPLGGFEVGGLVSRPGQYVDPAAGGLEIGGAMGDVFTPGSVVPGTDCFSAWEVEIGEPIGFSSTGSTVGYFKIDLDASTVYHMDVTGLEPDLTVSLAYSADCDTFAPVTPTEPHPGCLQWTTTVAARLVFWFTNTGATRAVSFEVSSGPCV